MRRNLKNMILKGWRLWSDSGWAELMRSFATQTSAGIKYGVPRIPTLD
jgi:hypothetical protein